MDGRMNDHGAMVK